jgi:hypothetical protein
MKIKYLTLTSLFLPQASLAEGLPKEQSDDKSVAMTAGPFLSHFGTRQYNTTLLTGLNLQIESIFPNFFIRPYFRASFAEGQTEEQKIGGVDFKYEMSTSSVGTGLIFQNPGMSFRMGMGVERESLWAGTDYSYKGESGRDISTAHVSYANMSIGNVWTIKNFVIGADWVEIKAPLSSSPNGEGFSYWLKRDAMAVERLNVLKFKIGTSF